MTIDSFLAVLDERIPTVDEMGELCDTLEIGFHVVNGVPSLKCNAGNRGEAEVLAKLFRREPFRSAIIERKLAGATVVPPLDEDDDVQEPIEVPPGAEIIVSDEHGHQSTDNRFSGPHMWTFIGAKQWYRIKEIPIPNR